MPNLSIGIQNFVFHIEKTFLCFLRRNCWAVKTSHKPSQRLNTGENVVAGGQALVRGVKSHTERFVRLRRCVYFCKRNGAMFYDSMSLLSGDHSSPLDVSTAMMICAPMVKPFTNASRSVRSCISVEHSENFSKISFSSSFSRPLRSS